MLMLKTPYHTLVPRMESAPPHGGVWNRSPWQVVQEIRLTHHMGPHPDHFPRTAFKIAYTRDAVHIIFQVADRYVRAMATGHQQSVCADSCVEFFFSPEPDATIGYFNLEINCGGTVLFHFHPKGTREEIETIPKQACDRIVSAHTLPCIVDPEIETPITWSLSCAIPMDLLKGYAPVHRPAPGVRWRANVYKCADKTSHPHWLTWSPVDFPRPNFHLPDFFGILEFE